MSSVHGYMVKFHHKPTEKDLTIFVAGHDLGKAYDDAKESLFGIMQREEKGMGSKEEIDKKPDSPQIERRWTVVSVSCVHVEVQ